MRNIHVAEDDASSEVNQVAPWNPRNVSHGPCKNGEEKKSHEDLTTVCKTLLDPQKQSLRFSISSHHNQQEIRQSDANIRP
uniref:Uncharacterized protein n=1 Tax=Nothoprocta perdicaria TaxID=30464 RepID=A0A8C6ZH51_NOTPE